MFEVGFSEIILILGIALLVLGPERLPKLAADVGRWVGKARAMARQLKTQLEQETGALGDIRKPLDELRKPLDELNKPVAGAPPKAAAATAAPQAAAATSPLPDRATTAGAAAHSPNVMPPDTSDESRPA